MPGAGKAEDTQLCRGLIHSPHGHGKTRLLETANDDDRTAPAILLASDSGTRSIVGSSIDVRRMRDWQDYNEAYEYVSSDANEYKTVMLDSVSETQAFGLLNILDIDKKRPDPDALSEADWGVILVQMRRLLRRWIDLDVNLFLTALSADTTVAKVGMVTAPLIQGKFQQDLPGLLDFVGYLAMEELADAQGAWTQRTLYLRPEVYPRFRVKARTPFDVEPPSEIVDPTIGSIMDALGYKPAK